MEYVELCSRRFSSVRQLCPDWAVFLVFILRRPIIVDLCDILKGMRRLLTQWRF